VSFILDGKDIGTVAAPYELPWRLAAGEHRIEIDSQGFRSPVIAFAVVD
jgi:hypothetical protein